MARPLTNTEADGALYARPSPVEAQIDEAIGLSRSDLQTRLSITDRNDPAYPRSECLVHLVREGRRTDDQQLMSAVLPVLLGRCEANLLVKVPDGGMPDAASVRQEILENLTDLFVVDGTGGFPDELDIYECRFNMAFRTLRIDAVRRAARQRTRHFLLMTATPHNGKEEDFQLFMALIDGDRFEGRFRDGVHASDVSDLMRRMVKENLLKFDATPLFPPRVAKTVPYRLTAC